MKELITALRIFVALTFLTGVVYPLVVTGIAQAAFREQANGSMIVSGQTVLGSRLVGQAFDDPKYFWGRPSATSPFAYNAAASSGSNLGPTNPALIGGKDGDDAPISGSIADRVAALKAADPDNAEAVPTELVTASGSGLDPHISVDAARYQRSRVAKARGVSITNIDSLIADATDARQFGFFGEPRVNVLDLNLALDALDSAR